MPPSSPPTPLTFENGSWQAEVPPAYSRVKAPQCPNRDGVGATMRADDSAAEEEVTGTAVYIVKAYLLAFGAAGK